MGGEPGKAHVGTPPFHARLSREDGPHGFRRLATSDRPPSRPSSSASRSKLAKFPTEKLRCFSKSFSPPLLLLLPWIVFFVEKGSWERAVLVVECLLLLVIVSFLNFQRGFGNGANLITNESSLHEERSFVDSSCSSKLVVYLPHPTTD